LRGQVIIFLLGGILDFFLICDLPFHLLNSALTLLI